MESFISRVQVKISWNKVNSDKLLLKKAERKKKMKTLDGWAFKLEAQLNNQIGNWWPSAVDFEQGLKMISDLPIKKQKASRNLLLLQ